MFNFITRILRVKNKGGEIIPVDSMTDDSVVESIQVIADNPLDFNLLKIFDFKEALDGRVYSSIANAPVDLSNTVFVIRNSIALFSGDVIQEIITTLAVLYTRRYVLATDSWTTWVVSSGGGGGLANLPVKNADGSTTVLATSLKFFNSTVAADPIPGQANITPLGGTGGLANLPIINSVDATVVLATSIKFNNSIVESDPNITGRAIITPAGSGGLPVVSPTNTILVTTTANATNIDLPQSVAQSATPSFAGLNIVYNTPNVSLLKKVLNYFASDVSDVAVAYNSNITTAPLTANRTLTLPDANTVTVIPTALQPNQVVQYISNDGVIHFTAAGGGGNNADFSFNPLGGAVPLTVQFTDLTQPVPTAWAWIINGTGVVAADYTYTNGTSATSQNPQVIFNNAKTYIITLTPTKAGTSYTPFSASLVAGAATASTFGTTSVFAKWLSSWITYPNIPAYVPNDTPPTNRYGIVLLPFNVTTNLFSDLTGSGTINGVRYIGSEQTPIDVNKGNGLYFPQSFSTNTDIVCEVDIDNLVFTCQFATALTNDTISVGILLANGSIVASRVNPINQPLAFFAGVVGEDAFFSRKDATVVVSLPDAQGYTTVTITNGVAVARADFTTDWVGSTTPYYLYVVVSDAINTGNVCTNITPIQLGSLNTISEYTLEMYLTLQGQTNLGIPGTLSVQQNAANIVPFANKLNFTNGATITQDPNDSTKANVAIAGGSIQFLFGSIAPASTYGNDGDLYLYYVKTGLLFIMFQKVSGTWTITQWLQEAIRNATLPVVSNLSLVDLVDTNLYPDFIDNDLISAVLNVSRTTTVLYYSNLSITITITGVSNNDYSTLQTNIILGRTLQCDGGRVNPVIGSWVFIVTSLSATGATDNRTVVILGHLRQNDAFSILAFANATVGVKTDQSWTYTNGGLIFVNTLVPDLTGTLIGLGADGYYTLVNVPPGVSNIQTFKTIADSLGAQTVIPFNSDNGSIGTPFGTMLNGVFTFTRAVYCEINVILDASADPDSWGTVNGDWANTKLNTFSGAVKGSSVQKKQFQVGDTYQYRPNNNVTFYGLGSTKCYIEFEAKN